MMLYHHGTRANISQNSNQDSVGLPVEHDKPILYR